MINRVNRPRFGGGYDAGGRICRDIGAPYCAKADIPTFGEMSEAPIGADVKKLIFELQKIDFSLADLSLYLDAYPECKRAMAYYKELCAKRDALRERIAELGYPLSYTEVSGERWNWCSSPWPWQYEANLR